MKFVRKILIEPNKSQKEVIDFWIRRCRTLYNIALEERIEYYRLTGKSLNVYEQKKELVDIKEFDASWKDIPNKCLQDVIFRLDTSYKNFFRNKIGFPKFKSEENYKSITFVESDVRIKDGKLYLPKIKTDIKYKEELPSKHGNVTLIKELDKYYLCFIVDIEVSKTHTNNDILGIDLGLLHLLTDSNGNKENRFSLKLFNNYQKRISDLNKSLSKKKRGSKRRKKVKKQLQKTHNRLKNSRGDFLHKVSNKIITKTKEQTIIVGDIEVSSIINNKKSRSGLKKSFYNSALTTFKDMLRYKGELNNKKVEFVNERYTSKTCSCCGHVKFNLSLSDRTYNCNNCELSIDRDENSAINIKNVWLGQFKPIGLNSHKEICV
jgi:putative transposase